MMSDCGEHGNPPRVSGGPMKLNAATVTAESSDAVRELCEAIRFTAEYAGPRILPPIEGWSWYDALRKYAPETAAMFRARLQEDTVMVGDDELRHGRWIKKKGRYADGCTEDRPHTEPPSREQLIAAAKVILTQLDPGREYVAVRETIGGEETLSLVPRPKNTTPDVLTVHEDGCLTYNGDHYVRAQPDGLPCGLAISEDGSLLNWLGENYERQTEGLSVKVEVVASLRKMLSGPDFNSALKAADLLIQMERGGML